MGHAALLAEEAAREGRGLLVVAGGDGTANEAINGLMAARAAGFRPPALAVLPVGRGNDFAHGAGFPAGLAEAVELLAKGSRRPLDVGRVTGGDYPQGRYFGNGVGVGFDTIVGLEAARMKRVHGFAAYVLGAAKTFLAFPPAPSVAVSFDGRRVERRAHQISLMNGCRMGGTFFMAPEAKVGDGLLDLCMSGDMTRGEMLGAILRYTKGSQSELQGFLFARSASFEIEAPDGGLVVHADGETICVNGFSLKVECLPGALELCGVRED